MKFSHAYFLAIGLFLAAPAFGEGGNVGTATLGKQALQEKDYREARKQFKIGVRAAREADDVDAETRFFYYLGLTEQAVGKAKNLKRAADYYRRVLELKPHSGATLVNLAQVVHRLGATEESVQLYRRAIGLDDDKRPAYEQRYADFLRGIGRGDEAIAYYRRLVREDPQNQDAQQAVSDYYLDADRPWYELERYLWELVRVGEIDRALDAAFESIEARSNAKEREILLTIIAAGLSRQYSSPADFVQSSWARSLSAVTRDRAIGAGAAQLINVYNLLYAFSAGDWWPEDNPYKHMDFSWWARGDSMRDPEVGLYPRDAFRSLMRSIGDRYVQHKQFATAEACYETAATFVPDEIDPAAIRDLVNLYGRTGEIDKIEELAGKYEFVLFQGKGDAYRNSRLEDIYQYHRTLAQIYGYLAEKTGDWGNSDKPNSAIFQLEYAVRVGEELDNLQGTDRESVRSHVDPGLVRRLAQAYDATGEKERGNELRLDAGERYAEFGDERAKNYVLKPVTSVTLQPEQIQRFEKLKSPSQDLKN